MVVAAAAAAPDILQYNAEVEDELVAIVFGVGDADGVAQDAVPRNAYREEPVAELLTRDYVGCNAGEGEERDGGGVG